MLLIGRTGASDHRLGTFVRWMDLAQPRLAVRILRASDLCVAYASMALSMREHSRIAI